VVVVCAAVHQPICLIPGSGLQPRIVNLLRLAQDDPNAGEGEDGHRECCGAPAHHAYLMKRGGGVHTCHRCWERSSSWPQSEQKLILPLPLIAEERLLTEMNGRIGGTGTVRFSSFVRSNKGPDTS
jgi:hypothetical protein